MITLHTTLLVDMKILFHFNLGEIEIEIEIEDLPGEIVTEETIY